MGKRSQKEHRIRLEGARQHNLKNVSLEIPHDELIAVTGISGSGKSSLAFDTIAMEGQRRFLESFSSHARQYLSKIKMPELDQLHGLPAVIALKQESGRANPRSTVGTVSGMYDLLRQLFAIAGIQKCLHCGNTIETIDSLRLSALISKQYAGKEIRIFYPVTENHQGAYLNELKDAVSAGFYSAYIDGELKSINPLPKIDPHKRHTIDVLVWVGVLEDSKAHSDYLSHAFSKGKGVCKIEDKVELKRFSTHGICNHCGQPAPNKGSRLFSFNSSFGACSECNGLGQVEHIDPDKLIKDEYLSLAEGVMNITTPNGYIMYSQVTLEVLNRVCKEHGFSIDIPWKDLTEEQRDVIWNGSERIKIPFGKHTLESRMKWSGITAKPREEGYYKGILPIMEGILLRDRNPNILKYASEQKCPSCQGMRLNQEALSVYFDELNIFLWSELPLSKMLHRLQNISEADRQKPDRKAILDELIHKINVLQKLGLGYLDLSRSAAGLSGGEFKRLRMGAIMGNALSHVLFVLDEPSLGLHPVDHDKLIQLLQELKERNNGILMVEHSLAGMLQADRMIDIGPGAGENGGNLLFNDQAFKAIQQAKEFPESKTIQHLITRRKKNLPNNRKKGEIRILNASKYNLKNIDVHFSCGSINAITGVSGAGKSTLLFEVLEKSLRAEKPVHCETIEYDIPVSKLISIDQSPIGRTPRSNPATYTKLSDHIRDIYAALPEAKARKWKKGRFSFNVKGGRCESCEGAGRIQIGMHFMGQVEVPCEKCGGKRFNDETLELFYRGKNIAQILELSVKEAIPFFEGEEKILRILKAMHALGLSYIRLGQSSTTLSGGEAQRIKLASELQKKANGHTLYLLDEPSAGLHPEDVSHLLRSLNAFAENGHTVILIDHHPDIILATDHIIDLGPGSGPDGGEIVVSGNIDDIINNTHSLTGNALKKSLEVCIPVEHAKEAVEQRMIRLEGVNTNNLKNISVNIPHHAITSIIGLSGSGKSSLAFDTLHAESRSRFLESFSSQFRRMNPKQAKADLISAKGLSPTISVRQERAGHNPRSTLATFSGLYDILRLLYSRVAENPDKQKGHWVLSSLFSFNHEQGACLLCKGLGYKISCSPVKFVSHPEKPVLEGAFSGSKIGKFYGDPYGQHMAILKAEALRLGLDLQMPYNKLHEETQNVIWYGSDQQEMDVVWSFKRKKREGDMNFRASWKGLIYYVNEEYERKHADKRGDSMLGIMEELPCPECGGSRLNPDALSYLFRGKNIGSLQKMSIHELNAFFEQTIQALDGFSAENRAVINELTPAIMKRIQNLAHAGLNYLEAGRSISSLSSGEFQRAKIASQMGSGLWGITYILDEPSRGLHPRDTRNLLSLMDDLVEEGSTVVVVEHDPDIIQHSDYVIELGPAGGSRGGEILACGTPEDLLKNPDSVAAQYLKKKRSIVREKASLSDKSILLKSIHQYHFKNIDLSIPTAGLIVISGVSGSGKSTLLEEVLLSSFERKKAIGCKEIHGLDLFDSVLYSEPDAVFYSPLSTTASYTGILDKIRKLFASLPQAKELGMKASSFSYAGKEGRCPACNGTGQEKINANILSDVILICDSCQGKRYHPSILEIQYKGLHIADILDMMVEEALEFFSDQKTIKSQLDILNRLGLSYLKLGQSASVLSGGEVQRIKLATELMKASKGRKLFLFDEPSGGLHQKDQEAMIMLFDALVREGHTVICSEHNPFFLANAEHVIDLGPEGGPGGGKLMAEGRPEEIVANEESVTARYLSDYL